MDLLLKFYFLVYEFPLYMYIQIETRFVILAYVSASIINCSVYALHFLTNIHHVNNTMFTCSHYVSLTCPESRPALVPIQSPVQWVPVALSNGESNRA